MTALLLTRRFLTDHVRNGVNLFLLLVVPVVFVIVAAPPLAETARLLGGSARGAGIEVATAGWAAAFLTSISMYFQVSGSKDTDRRLVRAGLPRRHLIAARLLTGAALAALATTAALFALATRTDLVDPGRAVAGTAMFAVTYLAVGAVVGATVTNPVNGTVVVMFVWILDVFFGPAFSGSASVLLRALPTHFASLWMLDLPSRHGGPSELAWAIAWVVGSVLVAALVIAGATRTSRGRRRVHRRAARGAARAAARGARASAQLGAGLVAGARMWRRVPAFWVLLLLVPAVFVLLTDATTPAGRTLVVVREAGRRFTVTLDPADIHSGLMAPIAVGSLACLVGVFVGVDTASADRRLALCGQRRRVLVGTRLVLMASAAVVATAASLSVVALVFAPHQWTPYAGGLLLVAVTYGLVGLVVGPVVGRVSGVFLAFLLPFLDLGIAQSPMLEVERDAWAQWLPGSGGLRIVIDGALTAGFDEWASFGAGLIWALGLLVVVLGTARLPSRVRPANGAAPSGGTGSAAGAGSAGGSARLTVRG